VRVDVGQMGWVGEVAVEKTGEEERLDFWREKIGDDVEACLPSGPGSLIKELEICEKYVSKTKCG
jgi:hypothetical protein